MKKLFTLLLALMAFSIGAQADNRTKISTVAGTSSDLATIPVVGESVEKDPTITVKKGAPAYFTAEGSNGKWQKKVNGEWKSVTSGTFTSGTWRLHTYVMLYGTQGYTLASDLRVKVDGLVWQRGSNYTATMVDFYSPEVTAKTETRSGSLGTKGSWTFADGVLTVTYNGQMPQNCTKDTTDPEVAYRLKWIDFLAQIEEVVVKGENVEIQPYFLYYESTETTDGNHPNDHIKKVTLGSGVKSIGKSAFSLYELNRVDCYKKEPPVLASDLSSSSKCFWKARVQANEAWLYTLPYAGVNYSFAGGEWSYFNLMGDLYPEDDPVGVSRPTPDPSLYGGEKHGWYTLDGQKLGGKPSKPGLYIKGGKKVLMK